MQFSRPHRHLSTQQMFTEALLGAGCPTRTKEQSRGPALLQLTFYLEEMDNKENQWGTVEGIENAWMGAGVQF